MLGFGEHKTPEAFRNACHKFIFTEILRPEQQVINSNTENSQKQTELHVQDDPPKQQIPFPKKVVLDALEQSSDDQGWTTLANFGSYLMKVQPDFDSRTFGHKKLSGLVKAKTDIFVTQERPVEGTNQKVLYVRAK